jgi:hypothetical protein
MASRPLIIASLLGASIGVPYFATRAGDNAAAPTPPAPAAAPTSAFAAPPLAAPATGPTATLGSPVAVTTAPSTATAPRSPSVDQALRFNVTKEWVYRSWDRKSTGPTDVGLYAVRVAMVSGTQPSSLAGSLTYYFNTQNQVEHISFRGRTGDPSRLIRFLMQTYQFQPASAPPGEQLYQVADRGGVQSELRTRPEPIASTSSPHAAHAIELELARPGSERYLPPRGPFLQVPQTADAALPAQQAATADAGGSSTAADTAASGSYLDKVRYATPQEETPARWKRWPD